MTDKTPGQAACEAFRAAIVGDEDPATAWHWAQERDVTGAWEAAAKAASVRECERLKTGLDAVTAERDSARESLRQLGQVTDQQAREIDQLHRDLARIRRAVTELADQAGADQRACDEIVRGMRPDDQAYSATSAAAGVYAKHAAELRKLIAAHGHGGSTT